MLTCETIQELLPLVVNGQLPAEDEGIVVLHLAVCEACMNELAELMALADSLRTTVNTECSPRPDGLDAIFDNLAAICRRDSAISPIDQREEVCEPLEPQASLADVIMNRLFSECPGLGWIRRAYWLYRWCQPDRFPRRLVVGPIGLKLM